MLLRHLIIPLLLAAFITSSCGDTEEPADVVQRRQIEEAVDRAREAITETKDFQRLVDPEIVVYDSAEIYLSEDREIRLISSSTTARIAGDSAEVHLTVTTRIDTVDREDRDAYVRLVRSGNEWEPRFAYLVHEEGDSLVNGR